MIPFSNVFFRIFEIILKPTQDTADKHQQYTVSRALFMEQIFWFKISEILILCA